MRRSGSDRGRDCTIGGAGDQRPTTTSWTVSPVEGVAPLQVTATVAGSDPDGTITSGGFEWYDGSHDDGTYQTTASHVFYGAGVYTIAAWVIDDIGLPSSVFRQRTIVVHGAEACDPGAPLSVRVVPDSAVYDVFLNNPGCTDVKVASMTVHLAPGFSIRPGETQQQLHFIADPVVTDGGQTLTWPDLGFVMPQANAPVQLRLWWQDTPTAPGTLPVPGRAGHQRRPVRRRRADRALTPVRQSEPTSRRSAPSTGASASPTACLAVRAAAISPSSCSAATSSAMTKPPIAPTTAAEIHHQIAAPLLVAAAIRPNAARAISAPSTGPTRARFSCRRSREFMRGDSRPAAAENAARWGTLASCRQERLPETRTPPGAGPSDVRSRMPRPIWGGAISFGLVNVPVRMFAAIASKDVRFHQLHVKDHVRIQQRRVCTPRRRRGAVRGGREGLRGRARRLRHGTQEELDSIAPRATRSIEIEEFVELSEIDPMLYEHSYYLVPGDGAAKAYTLLLRAMEDSGKVALGRVVIRTKQYLAAIRPVDNVLALATMSFADEVVPQSDIPGVDGAAEPAARELEMAKTLVESLSGPFEPEPLPGRLPPAPARPDREEVEGPQVRGGARRGAAGRGRRPHGRARGEPGRGQEPRRRRRGGGGAAARPLPRTDGEEGLTRTSRAREGRIDARDAMQYGGPL